MKYRYRWYYSMMLGLLVLISGFLYDVWPRMHALNELRVIEQSLVKEKNKKDQLASVVMRAVTKETHTMSDTNDRISSVMMLAQLSGLTTLSIETMPIAQATDSGMVAAHWIMQGHFQHLVDFILALNKQPFAAAITHVSFKAVGRNTLQAVVDLMVSKQSMTAVAEKPEVIAVSDPFCATTQLDYVMQKNVFSTMQSISLRQIKMIGYLEHDNEITAFVLLPDLATVAVHEGAILGLEHGRVSKIQHDRLVIELANGQSTVIARAA